MEQLNRGSIEIEIDKDVQLTDADFLEVGDPGGTSWVSSVRYGRAGNDNRYQYSG